MNVLIRLMLLLLLIPSALAATIEGDIYTLELDLAKNAIVTIDTQPVQRLVARDGTYRFNVPSGSYTLVATYEDLFGEYALSQEIVVVDDGTYNADLILLPDFSEDESLGESDIESGDPFDETERVPFTLRVIIGFIVLVIAWIVWHKKMPKPMHHADDLPQQILDTLQQEGGRMLQSKLRKKFPVSEAKVSLTLSELEGKGKIEKIKRGKGNLIVLK